MMWDSSQLSALMVLIFMVLFAVLVLGGTLTGARPRTPRQWMAAWGVLVFLAWALLGFGWIRSV